MLFFLGFLFFVVIQTCLVKVRSQGDVLLMADTNNHAIHKLYIKTGNDVKILPHQGKNPVAVDYDPVAKKMFWTDVGLKEIRSSEWDGTNETLVRHTGSSVDGIAVDAISRLILYTDTGKNVIAAMTMDGLYHKVLINQGLLEPRDIEVDPINGVFYWTDWGAHPYIAKANYDGTGRQDIITTAIVWPNGIALDLDGNKLYWCESSLHKIESSFLDGSGRKTVLHETSASYFGLSFYHGILYFTDWRRRSAMKINSNGTSLATIGPTISGSRLNDIQVAKSIEDQGQGPNDINGCTIHNGGCSQICLPKSQGNVVCTCSDGYYLHPDGSCKLGQPSAVG